MTTYELSPAALAALHTIMDTLDDPDTLEDDYAMTPEQMVGVDELRALVGFPPLAAS
jgi:hypothetical protein